MSFSLSDIKDITSVVFFNQVNDGASLQKTSWVEDGIDLGFSPDFAVVRTVDFNTTSEGKSTQYEVQSSLSKNRSLATFSGNSNDEWSRPIVSNPQQLIKLDGNPIDSANFKIMTYETDGTNKRKAPDSTNPLGTGVSSISISIDFIQLKRPQSVFKV